ncbi:MAG: MBL fold metallo-hydrolase [Candidatus Vogelbacteria bacterium]|nr:MBL fold metallo-hydrolase [Candidatus Vogelbacteria bacterium]
MSVSDQTSITFHGGAGTVTGANFLLEVSPSTPLGTSRKFLIDCGLFQGGKIVEDKNREPFPYNPASIDALLVTHAHLDHVGRIPKLVREGFHGVIYSTPPTRDIAELILTDSLGVMEKEAKAGNKPLLYREADVRAAMNLWQTRGYEEKLELGDANICFRDAGHILGSAMIEVLTVGPSSGGASRKIVFTGDLGNSPSPLLADTASVSDADYLVMESVYGDRAHAGMSERRDKLEDAIENTMRAGGTLMIPAFSIERTQELLYEIEQMMAEGRIPEVPVYLDSPLAIQVTAVYKKYESYFNERVSDPDFIRDGLFNFRHLKKTLSTGESKAIPPAGRKVIIAGSGMSNGGRIIHHEKHYLVDPKNTLLLVGYQSVGSLGRQLQDGVRTVTILGESVPVRAKVLTLSGYSAHRDRDGLLAFVELAADSLKKVFVAMGEPQVSFFLAQRIRDYLGLQAVVPRPGEKLVLD